MKKKFILLILFVMLVTSCSNSEYPSKTITMVIPYGIGGTTDKIGRELASALERQLNVKVIVKNQIGASGSVATKSVYNSSSDGYTLFFSADSLGTQKVMGLSKIGYEDFDTLLLTANDPKVIVVNSKSKYKNINMLLDDMKNNKKVKLSYTGAGGSGHVQSLILKKYGYNSELIAYSGGRDCILSVLSNQVDFTNANYSTVKNYVKSGELKIIAVASNERLKGIDAPALTEVIDDTNNYMDLEFTPLSLLIKKGVDDPVKNKLKKAIESVKKDKKFNKFLDENLIDTLYVKYKSEQEVKDFYNTWESKVCYLLYDAKVTKYNPKDFGIER